MDDSKDLKAWLTRKFSLEVDEVEKVKSFLTEIIKSHGFKIIKETGLNEGVSIEGIYGSKIIAFLTNLIPFIGRHLPIGKRLGLKASVIKDSSVNVHINISPYMELFNTSEVLVLSQSADEKATDEYIAAKKIHSITKELHSKLYLSIPEKFEKFDTKTFAIDTFLSMLIYPLDGYKSSKKIHIPEENGPKWCWPAFIIPEVWFVWNEIWGASIFAILIELYGIGKLFQSGVPAPVIIFLIVTLRTFLGRFGNKIYFLKYGKWPN